MKEPVRAKSSGLVFERATIELWLDTRGAVCPISNTHLEREDLEAAEDLRSRQVSTYFNYILYRSRANYKFAVELKDTKYSN